MHAQVVLPALLTALAASAGAKGTRPRVAFAAALAAGGVIALLMAGERAAGVHAAAFVEGVVLGGALIGFLPLLAYYLLGRVLRGHRVVLGVLWVASLVPLGIYLFVALLVSVALVHCPPGSYECPV